MIKPPGNFFITLPLNFGKVFRFGDEKKRPLDYTFWRRGRGSFPIATNPAIFLDDGAEVLLLRARGGIF
jgi:hypothetical protein